MAWLAPSISANDLSMLLWLIYYKQGTNEKTAGLPHSLDICTSLGSPTEMFSLAQLGFPE